MPHEKSRFQPENPEEPLPYQMGIPEVNDQQGQLFETPDLNPDQQMLFDKYVPAEEHSRTSEHYNEAQTVLDGLGKYTTHKMLKTTREKTRKKNDAEVLDIEHTGGADMQTPEKPEAPEKKPEVEQSSEDPFLNPEIGGNEADAVRQMQHDIARTREKIKGERNSEAIYHRIIGENAQKFVDLLLSDDVQVQADRVPLSQDGFEMIAAALRGVGVPSADLIKKLSNIVEAQGLYDPLAASKHEGAKKHPRYRTKYFKDHKDQESILMAQIGPFSSPEEDTVAEVRRDLDPRNWLLPNGKRELYQKIMDADSIVSDASVLNEYNMTKWHEAETEARQTKADLNPNYIPEPMPVPLRGYGTPHRRENYASRSYRSGTFKFLRNIRIPKLRRDGDRRFDRTFGEDKSANFSRSDLELSVQVYALAQGANPRYGTDNSVQFKPFMTGKSSGVLNRAKEIVGPQLEHDAELRALIEEQNQENETAEQTKSDS